MNARDSPTPATEGGETNFTPGTSVLIASVQYYVEICCYWTPSNDSSPTFARALSLSPSTSTHWKQLPLSSEHIYPATCSMLIITYALALKFFGMELTYRTNSRGGNGGRVVSFG